MSRLPRQARLFGPRCFHRVSPLLFGEFNDPDNKKSMRDAYSGCECNHHSGDGATFLGRPSTLLVAQSEKKYKAEDSDNQSCLGRGRVKFDLAADIIDYEDYECMVKWQMAQE